MKLQKITGQAVVPLQVVSDLLDSIFRMKRIFDSFIMALVISTLGLFALITWLSIKMRAEIISTFKTIGASSLSVAVIIGIEVLALLFLSGLSSLVMYYFTDLFIDSFINYFIL